MKDLRIGSTCDRGMLVPQPAKWVRGYDETVAALTSEKWDELRIWDHEDYEQIALFLRDNPEHCPPRIVLSWSLDPITSVKLKIWLPGKVHDWND